MMDEKTELVGTRFPEEVVAWLKGEAKARSWNLSRTVRWAVQETMKRETKPVLARQPNEWTEAGL